MVGFSFCRRDKESLLKKMSLRDSKALSQKQRLAAYEALRKFMSFRWIEVSAEDLNQMMGYMSLNDIEAKVMAGLIKKLPEGDVMIDMPDRYSWTFRKRMDKFGVKRFEAEHKADEKYPIVAAASICAKIIRERKIEEIRNTTCDFGSGYPSDRKTIAALKDKGSRELLDPFIRKKWKTLETIQQTKLFEGEDG